MDKHCRTCHRNWKNCYCNLTTGKSRRKESVMLNKSLKLTTNQYRAAIVAHSILGDLLTQASPTDETPLEITVGEVLEVAGKRLAAVALGN